MLRQIELLARVQLANFFGLNEARFSRDPKQRRSRIAMLCLIALLLLMFSVYVGLACYGLIRIGMAALLPVLLAVVTGLVVLVYSVIRAGTVLFDLRSYEMLSALPLKPVSIVISRFATMYAADAGMTLMLFLPAAIVCGVMQRPGFHFYPMMLLGALLLPLIPLALAMLLGMAIHGATARMRHRNAAVIVLSLLATAAVLCGSMLMPAAEDLVAGMLFDFVDRVGNILGRAYPPALWLGNAVNQGNWLAFAAFAAVSIGVFLLTAVLVGKNFSAICTLLHAQRTQKSFRMNRQREGKPFAALFFREVRRYFSCPIYVMNTLVGGMMAVIMGAAALAFRSELLLADLVLGGIIRRFAPIVVAMPFVISPTTSSSISVEGKQLWLLQSLPVRRKMIMDGKLALNLAVMLPCWMAAEILLHIALPVSGIRKLWLWVTPLVYILFMSVLGLAVNLRMPMMNWETPAQPVKQSKSVAIVMLCGFLSVLLPAAGLYLLPAFADAVMAASIVLLVFFAALLYRWCCSFPLNSIGE